MMIKKSFYYNLLLKYIEHSEPIGSTQLNLCMILLIHLQLLEVI